MELTIRVPDDLLSRIAAMPEGEERNRFAIAALSDPITDALADALLAADPPDEKETLVEAVEAGIADAEAGRSITLEEYRAELAARRARRGVQGGL